MTTLEAQSAIADILKLIGRIEPGVWQHIADTDLIDHGVTALQPQPLPPVELAQTRAVEMAQAFARKAIDSEIDGRSGTSIISELVDDWCLTPWPRRWR